MTNKKNWLGMLIIVLAFGITVTSCSNNQKVIMTYSGDGIAEAWPIIRQIMGDEGATIDDSKYTISMTSTEDGLWDDSSEEYFLSSVQINQNGAKIKFPISEETELIMTKQ